MATPDIIIVGAGIVGCACARRLSQDGRSVLVVDAAPPGSGATAAGMGHVVVMDDSPAQFALTRYSQVLWNDLAPHLPPAADRVVTGTIWVASDDEEMAAVHSKAAFYTARGVPVEVLDGHALRAAEPNLRPSLAGGLRVVEDSVVYPPVVAAWLVEKALQHGARAKLGKRVTAIQTGAVVLEDGERLQAGIVINACGAWSPGLTAGLPIRRRKGHLVITDRYPGFSRHQLVELGYLKNAHASDADSVSFNIQPRGTGQMLVGSSRQFDPVDAAGSVQALDAGVDDAMVGKMIRRAQEFMPALAQLRGIRVWTGFRAATPDSLPLIGPHPELEGVWLATGHEGLGITTSLGTAEVLGDLLAGREAKIDALAYSPGRAFQHGH